MSAQLVPVLVVVVTSSGLIAAWLFATKVIGHFKGRFDQFRRASYIGALSEIVTRSGYPLHTLRSWAADRVFLDTLLDFLRSVQGRERANLLRIARDLGIVQRFVWDLERSRRRERRVVAASALAELGDPSTADALLAALGDRVPEVRVQAADALAGLKDPRAVPPLVKLLEEETDWNASRIADSLVKLGTVSVPVLARYLILSDPAVDRPGRRLPLVARVLGSIGDVGAEPALLSALDGDEVELRIRAAAALGTAGTPQCVPALMRAVADPAWEVRAQAVKALGERMDPRAVDVLIEALRDRQWWVRRNAAEALALIPGGRQALIDAQGDQDAFARDAAREQLMLNGNLPVVGSLGADDTAVREAG
ncbi:putative lyase [bacterium BMS3Abin02]|nr:putative lyase [bacterium BMS3Abin02]GBE20982.1 putative lyase [bacterium BMS3Bbin01]HDH26153.1 HEAT repeat domain-containing protein [Actinomycetota bacterium]HDK45738.1 HEAT repeat domain-containing protein [Actinomycetota bacterium]